MRGQGISRVARHTRRHGHALPFSGAHEALKISQGGLRCRRLVGPLGSRCTCEAAQPDRARPIRPGGRPNARARAPEALHRPPVRTCPAMRPSLVTGTPPENCSTSDICSSTRKVSRTASVSKPSKDSAQSPPWIRKPSPEATLARLWGRKRQSDGLQSFRKATFGAPSCETSWAVGSYAHVVTHRRACKPLAAHSAPRGVRRAPGPPAR